MSDNIILTLCVFGAPFVAIALIIGAVGFVLRRVRPDLYMSDEEKQAAAEKLAAEMEANENNHKE